MNESELYLNLYDSLIDDAEYLQADSDARHMLPEPLVIGALGAVLVTFSNGFFGRLGQRLADGTADKILKLTRRGTEAADSDALLEALALLQPLLPLLRQYASTERDDAIQQVAQVLHGRGFPEAAARDVAGRIFAQLEQAGAVPAGGSE